MAEETAPKRPGRPPRFSQDELEQARADAAAGIGTLDPPRLLRSRRAQQNRKYEQEGMEVLRELMGMRRGFFHWWLQHPRQHAALVELGRLAYLNKEDRGTPYAIVMLLDRAEPKGAMTAARAIRGFRLALTDARRRA
jgi:hypothetical protein